MQKKIKNFKFFKMAYSIPLNNQKLLLYFLSFSGHPVAARGANSLPLGGQSGHIVKYHWLYGVAPQNEHNFNQT